MTFAQPFRDYEILDRVGAGAMGTVFKARHGKLSRIVALKVLRPSLARDKRYVDRLRREARIVAALNHPNIVTGYDLGEEGGYHYFVMEFVEGKSLKGLLAEWGVLPQDQTLDVAMQVASALDHALQRGVIHRDIKPGNILIDEKGTVKVTDMGLAKGPADLTLTRDGATVGTPQYISPEQARNPQDVDVRSDLYSLGATLYHMATGQPPFQGTTMAEVISQVLHETPISPRVINPSLSEGLSLVIRKLLAKNPKLRYQTPRELLDDLERVKHEERPAVDERRLVAGESDGAPTALRSSLAIVAAFGFVALGFWLGGGFSPARSEGPTDGTAWSLTTRAELESLPTPGARWLRFLQRTRGDGGGTADERVQLQRELTAALQTEVDAFATEATGPGLERVAKAARDAQRWPDRATLVREHMGTPLATRLGLAADQLPSGVSTASLGRATDAIAALVRQRDSALEDRARQHFEIELPMRADERVRQGDFVAAERLWREGFFGFFDGLRQPLPDRLAGALRTELEERFARLREAGLAQLDAAEASAAAAMTEEGAQVLAVLRERLGAADGTDAVADAARAFARARERLLAAHPGPGRFRAALDPWPRFAASATGFEHEVELRTASARAAATDQFVDLAWRAFADGSADAALLVLQSAEPAVASEALAGHRVALEAAKAVVGAVLAGLQSAPPPVPGYPRNGGVPVELRVVDGELEARIAGGSWRSAQLTEFRFADLYRRARARSEAFEGLDPAVLRTGRALLAMVGDQLDELARAEPEKERAFLLEQVWPRLLRARSETSAVGEDRAVALQRLRDALARARTQHDARDLETVLAQWQVSYGEQASTAERALAAEALRLVERERERQTRLADLRAKAPPDSSVRVEDDGGVLTSIVAVAGPALRDAGEGWQLRGGGLEYACAAPVWAEVAGRRLHVDGGLAAASRETTVDVEFSLPAEPQGERFFVVDFRGLAFVLMVGGDGCWLSASVRGSSGDASAVQGAVRRAVLAAVDRAPRGPRALPLAVHALRIALQPGPSGRSGTAVLLLDGVELCRDAVTFEAATPPALVLQPMLDVAVRSVRFAARD